MEKRSTKTVDEIMTQYDEILESYVYEKIWSELSPREQCIVAFLSDKGNARVKEIREAIGEPNNAFSVYRDRLMKKGIIDTKTYGFVSLKLPRFGLIIRNWIDV